MTTESNNPWSPEFSPSESFETARAHVVPSFPQYAEIDYVATMDSYEHLKSTQKYPQYFQEDVYTIKHASEALEHHQREFEARETYGYTVLSSVNKEECVGCVYFAPIGGHRTSGFQVSPIDENKPAADFTYWVTRQHIDSDLDLELLKGVLAWVEKEWPFETLFVPYYETDKRGPKHAAELGLSKRDGYDNLGRIVYEWNLG